MENEVWLPSHVFGELYEVSSLGRVRSAKGVRALHKDKDGYPTVNLHNRGQRRAINVHRLVALTFHAEHKNELHKEVAHLDGNRTNCRADNLQWVGRVQNHSHKRIHGTLLSGEKHPLAKLSAVDVLEIRELLRRGEKCSVLARRYGVSQRTVNDIKLGKRWRLLGPVGEADAPNSPTQDPY